MKNITTNTTITTTIVPHAATKASKRDGRSLKVTPLNASKALLVSLGYTDKDAALVINTRRYLPYSTNQRKPEIDAEALWARLGKPHKQFNKWADYNIKPLLDNDKRLGEIYPYLKQGKTKPKQGYMLSRNVAAHLAMQANTKEGETVRDYFILMERVALDLIGYASSRCVQLIPLDNRLTSAIHHNAPIGMSKWEHNAHCTAIEREFKGRFAEAITGFRAGHWKVASGSSKGIRDQLSLNDLDIYGSAYLVAVSIYMASGSIDAAMDTVSAVYHIDPCDYFHPEMIDSMITWAIDLLEYEDECMAKAA